MPSSKEHKRVYMREYRLKNLERIHEANRQYYWNHRDKLLAYAKKYRDEQKAKMTEKDIEESRAYHRIMYRMNKERKKEMKK